MRQNFNHEFIAAVQGKLGLATPTNTGGCSSDAKSISCQNLCIFLYSSYFLGFQASRIEALARVTYIVVPGSNVVPCEQKLTNSGTSKMRSLFIDFHMVSLRNITQKYFARVIANKPAPKIGIGDVITSTLGRLGTYSRPLSCTTLPFNNPRICNLAGSLTALADTRTGPMGQAPSKPLEKHHWLWFSWLTRLEISLDAV